MKVYDYELCSDSAPLWALVLRTSCEEATPWLLAGLTLPCLGWRTSVEVYVGFLLFFVNPGPCLLPLQKTLSTCCLPSQGQSAAGGRCPVPAVSRAPPHGRGPNDKSAKRASGSFVPGQPGLPAPMAWTLDVDKDPLGSFWGPSPEAAQSDWLRLEPPESSPSLVPHTHPTPKAPSSGLQEAGACLPHQDGSGLEAQAADVLTRGTLLSPCCSPPRPLGLSHFHCFLLPFLGSRSPSRLSLQTCCFKSLHQP